MVIFVKIQYIYYGGRASRDSFSKDQAKCFCTWICLFVFSISVALSEFTDAMPFFFWDHTSERLLLCKRIIIFKGSFFVQCVSRWRTVLEKNYLIGFDIPIGEGRGSRVGYVG